MIEKGNILLVDDDAGTLKMYTYLLTRENYNVHKFTSAVEAISFLRFTDKQFELIVADLNMPVMDGLKFLKEVRDIHKYIATPFVFLTAIDDPAFRLKAYQSGAVDYMQKPLDNDLFVTKIKALIESFHLYALKQNIVFTGSEKVFSLEDLISYCEQERLSGYAYLYRRNHEGMIEFENGVLKHIRCDNHMETQAFEQMRNWEDFRFLVARGKYSPASLKFLQK